MSPQERHRRELIRRLPKIQLPLGSRFTDVDLVAPITGDSYKASEGIKTGDYGLLSTTREPKPGDLVMVETPHEKSRLMRLMAGERPYLHSENPDVQDVLLETEGVFIVGTLVDTMRNPMVEFPR